MPDLLQNLHHQIRRRPDREIVQGSLAQIGWRNHFDPPQQVKYYDATLCSGESAFIPDTHQKPIGVASYRLQHALPLGIQEALPSIQHALENLSNT